MTRENRKNATPLWLSQLQCLMQTTANYAGRAKLTKSRAFKFLNLFQERMASSLARGRTPSSSRWSGSSHWCLLCQPYSSQRLGSTRTTSTATTSPPGHPTQRWARACSCARQSKSCYTVQSASLVKYLLCCPVLSVWERLVLVSSSIPGRLFLPPS